MWKKCRNGRPNLNRRLGCRLGRYVIRRLDGRRFRPPNRLAIACRVLESYLRLRKQAARAHPHLFGPHAGRYHQDTLKLVEEQREIQAALDKVYGPPPPGQEWHPGLVWDERYEENPAHRRCFRKWFKEHYGE